EVAHILGASAGLPAGGKRLRQQILERFASRQPLAKVRREGLQLLIAQGPRPFFESVHTGEQRSRSDRVGLAGVAGSHIAQFPDEALVAGTVEPCQELTYGF